MKSQLDSKGLTYLAIAHLTGIDKIAMSLGQAFRTAEYAPAIAEKMEPFIARATRLIAGKGTRQGVFLDVGKLPRELQLHYLRQAMKGTMAPAGLAQRLELGLPAKKYYKRIPHQFVTV